MCLRPWVVHAGLLVRFSNLSIRNFIMGWFSVSSGSLPSLWDSFPPGCFSPPHVGPAGSGGSEPAPPARRWNRLSASAAFPPGMEQERCPSEGFSSCWQIAAAFARRIGAVRQITKRVPPVLEVRWFSAAFRFCPSAAPAGLWAEGGRQWLWEASRGRSCSSQPGLPSAV